MGLDQFAYVAAKENDDDNTREIAYWRKHPNLQGWMEQLWKQKGSPGITDKDENGWGSNFNGIELELTWADIELLEEDIKNNNLPNTTGFFFGNDSDDHYREKDLEFVRNAKAELFMGLKVFYNSSW